MENESTRNVTSLKVRMLTTYHKSLQYHSLKLVIYMSDIIAEDHKFTTNTISYNFSVLTVNTVYIPIPYLNKHTVH